jgi:tight adherence protein C
MFTLNHIILGALFLFVASLVYLLLNQWIPGDLEKRCMSLVPLVRAKENIWFKRFQSKFLNALLSMGPWAGKAVADDALVPSGLQLRLLNAGLRSSLALPIFLGMKTLLTFCLPACFALLFWLLQLSWPDLMFWTGFMASAAAGYYLPDLVLHRLVQRQQKILFHAIPDALDLMRLCVQAGLGLDSAIERVGREMRLSYPQLSDEFALTGLELRAGSSRADALRHLSLRMGLSDIDGLVSMLIQADRFGTSIGESLEVHSDALRTKRRLIAEEAAAKLPIKLLIPLIFCVFPALMTVLLGPVVISITQNLLPLVNN